MPNQTLNPLKACLNCGSEKTLFRDGLPICAACKTPLVEEVPIEGWDRPSVWNLNSIQALKEKVLGSEHLLLLWQKLGRKNAIIGGGAIGVLLLGTGLLLGFENVAPSSAALGSEEVTILGDTFVGYSSLRSPEFQATLKAQGIDLKYAHEFNQSNRAQMLASGEADLMATTLDQVVKHQPDGKIVGILDYTKGADAVLLNTKQFPFLKDMKSLSQEVEKAAKHGQQYSIVYAEDTPSEYLTLVLANEFPGIRLEQFNKVPVADASEAYELLQDPNNNIAVAVLWDPFVTQAKKQGYEVVLTSADVPETIVDVLVASNDFIEQEPEELTQFLAAYYGRIDGSRLDKTALMQQIAAEANVSGSAAFSLLNGIYFFNAPEASKWMTSGKLDQRIGYTSSILKASGRISQQPKQTERLYNGTFLNLAVANTTQLEQQLQGQVPRVAPTDKPKVASAQPKAVDETVDISQSIEFELSSILLDTRDKKAIDTVLETAKGFGGKADITLTGHSSASDDPQRNETLSRAQVNSVANYIKSKSYPGELTAKRVGSMSPLPGIKSTDPRNQRVQITLSSGG